MARITVQKPRSPSVPTIDEFRLRTELTLLPLPAELIHNYVSSFFEIAELA
jgi:hypothetical protein